jgi:hypothetical protein
MGFRLPHDNSLVKRIINEVVTYRTRTGYSKGDRSSASYKNFLAHNAVVNGLLDDAIRGAGKKLALQPLENFHSNIVSW